MSHTMDCSGVAARIFGDRTGHPALRASSCMSQAGCRVTITIEVVDDPEGHGERDRALRSVAREP